MKSFKIAILVAALGSACSHVPAKEVAPVAGDAAAVRPDAIQQSAAKESAKKIIWQEDFENKDKVMAEWREFYQEKATGEMLPAKGILSLDQSRKVGGKQCARISPGTNKSQTLVNIITAEMPKNQGGVLTAWMYDYNESFAYFTGIEIEGETPAKSFRLFASLSTPYLFTVENPGKLKGKGQNVLRRAGWRKIQFVLDKEKTKGKIRAYVDGHLVSESERQFESFNKIKLGAAAGMLRFWALFFDSITLDANPDSMDSELFRGVDLIARTERIGNIFNAGEEIELNLDLINYGGAPKQINVAGKLFGADGQFLMDTPGQAGELPADKSGQFKIKFPAPNRKGPLFVKIAVKEGSVLLAEEEAGIGVIEDPSLVKSNDRLFLGAHVATDFFKKGDLIDIGFAHFRAYGRWANWNVVEPEKGKMQWSETDPIMEHLAQTYRSTLYCLGCCPLWASDPARRKNGGGNPLNYPPANMEDWQRYVEKIVGHYKDKVKYWEVWNEVNSGYYLGTPEEYFQMLKIAYETIKRIDPRAKVVGITCTGGGFDFVEKVLKLGGSQYFDILGKHFYPHDKPEKNMLQDIAMLHKIMARYGEVKPIWDTEFGFYTAGLGEDNRPKSPQQVKADKALGLIAYSKMSADSDIANWLIRALILLRANGVERIFYHGHPMVHGNGMAKYFTYSFANCTQQLGTAEFVRRIDLGNPNLHAYLFKDDGRHIAVLWTVEGEETIALKLDKPDFLELDLWGNAQKRRTEDMTAELHLTESPVYLKEIDANITQVAQNFVLEVPSPAKKRSFMVEACVKNQKKLPLEGTVVLNAPEGWQVRPQTAAIRIPSNATAKVAFELLAAPDVYKGAWPLQAGFSADNGKITRQTGMEVQTMIPAACPRIKKALVVDGDVADWTGWENALKIENESQVKFGLPSRDHVVHAMALEAGETFWEGRDDLSVKFLAAWDENTLYLGVKVKDDKSLTGNDKNSLFAGDSVELFLDGRNLSARGNECRDAENCVFHLLATPAENGGGNLWIVKKGVWNVAELDAAAMADKTILPGVKKIRLASKLLPDGYSLEVSIPFDLLGAAKPRPGDTLRFDMAVNDRDREQAAPRAESSCFWMGEIENNKNPENFGAIELAE